MKTRSHMGGRILNDSPCSKTNPTEGLNLSLSLYPSRPLPRRDAINSDRVCQVCRDRASGMRPRTCRREDSFAFPRTNTGSGLSVQHVVTKLHLIISTLSLWSFPASAQSFSSPDREKTPLLLHCCSNTTQTFYTYHMHKAIS